MAVKGNFDKPDPTSFVDFDALSLTNAAAQWMTRIHTIANAEQQSGTTADRPIDNLWAGRRYWDTTLGIPVFVKSVRPIVWVNAAGNPV